MNEIILSSLLLVKIFWFKFIQEPKRENKSINNKSFLKILTAVTPVFTHPLIQKLVFKRFRLEKKRVTIIQNDISPKITKLVSSFCRVPFRCKPEKSWQVPKEEKTTATRKTEILTVWKVSLAIYLLLSWSLLFITDKFTETSSPVVWSYSSLSHHFWQHSGT